VRVGVGFLDPFWVVLWSSDCLSCLSSSFFSSLWLVFSPAFFLFLSSLGVSLLSLSGFFPHFLVFGWFLLVFFSGCLVMLRFFLFLPPPSIQIRHSRWFFPAQVDLRLFCLFLPPFFFQIPFFWEGPLSLWDGPHWEDIDGVSSFCRRTKVH